MQFSQLNNDVVLEIFLQFVAIDWDGPFTLMLVCTKWSNLVVSQPRVWTWIMVDDTQAEWRERMEIAAHLSKDLPLQIVLRVPFVSQMSLPHITGRCTSLFVDSKRLEDYYLFKRSRSWVKAIVSYERFTTDGAELKQCNDSLLNFLEGTGTHDIQIRNEDHYHTSFAYSAWHVYERLNQRASIQEVLTPGEMIIITALVFKHSESAPLPRIQAQATDLWGVLPLLPSLSYLELAENYIRVPKNAVLAHIQLRPLQTLKLESPMTGSIFFSFEDDVWLGLLSLLEFITAPNLDDLSLYGPLHRIIAAMIKAYGRFHPLQLNISVSVFDETVDQEQLDSKSVWHGLRRCTVAIPEQSKARRYADAEVMDALHLLFNLLPRHCSVQLHGDAILEPIMQSDLLMDAELHLVTHMDYSGNIHKPLISPRKIRSLSIIGKYSEPRKYECTPWVSSVDELCVYSADKIPDWGTLTSIWGGVTLCYPNGSHLPMQVLECASTTRFQPDVDIGDVIRHDTFSNLTEIQCDDSLAAWMITNHETPQLRSLTLSYGIDSALEVVERASRRLLSLDTLGVHLSNTAEWLNLLHFVAHFNRSVGRGISIVKLRDLPHPAILHYLGRAFRGEVDEPYILGRFIGRRFSQLKKRYPDGCYECTLFGWSCYEYQHCNRWRRNNMVTITADMLLTEYKRDWGPVGQGWEDDFSSSDESEMENEHENPEVTNENSGE